METICYANQPQFRKKGSFRVAKAMVLHMRIYTTVPLINRHFSELNPVDCGEEYCVPSHSFGPAIRKYMLLHYIISGSGVLQNERGRHFVGKGQAFVIRPGEVTTYTASKNDPWHYIWIGFDGTLSERFRQLPDIFTPPRDIFEKLMRCTDYPNTAEEYLAGRLFGLYAKLFCDDKPDGNYLPRIHNYIDSHYQTACRVGDIAEALGLERHYLSRLYRQKTGTTLKDAITNKKLTEAKNLLAEGKSVSDAAAMVGYADPFLFSKSFKRLFGITPREAIDKKE